MTGAATRPVTTLGSAPSIPATVTTTSAARTVVQPGEQAVEARDADVGEEPAADPERREGGERLVRHRQVGGARRDDEDVADRGREGADGDRATHPVDRDDVVGEPAGHGVQDLVRAPRRERRDRRVGAAQDREQVTDLRERLPGGVHHLGDARPGAPAGVRERVRDGVRSAHAGAICRLSDPERKGWSSISASGNPARRTASSTAACSSGARVRPSSSASSCTRPSSPNARTRSTR